VLRTGVDVRLRQLLGEVDARGLGDDLSADVAPVEVVGVLLAEDGDLFAVDDQGVRGRLYLAGELAVHGVVLEEVRQILGVAQVVDADDLNVGVIEAVAEDHAADAAKAVDTDFCRAHNF